MNTFHYPKLELNLQKSRLQSDDVALNLDGYIICTYITYILIQATAECGVRKCLNDNVASYHQVPRFPLPTLLIAVYRVNLIKIYILLVLYVHTFGCYFRNRATFERINSWKMGMSDWLWDISSYPALQWTYSSFHPVFIRFSFKIYRQYTAAAIKKNLCRHLPW